MSVSIARSAFASSGRRFDHGGLRVVRQRSRHDAMAPIGEKTWLVVTSEIGDSLYVRELPPMTDSRMVMIEMMSRSIRMGFEVEELQGVIPIFVCRRGEERRFVSIVRTLPHPPEKSSG
jgi:hypothetical protein